MTDKKDTGKKAGSTRQWKQQYGQIGGGKPSERLDSQESNHQALQDANNQAIQPSESLDIGESSMLHSTTVEHPSVQKSRSKQRDKLTVYLEPDLNDWVRQQVIIEKRRRGHHVEISDIINEALRKAKEGN